ncbi:hypothetical protein CEE45_05765 [Candidatus Heimdallarchaeota archaeon B3_Heim]|nr:MAG: hypothetical protein CEE45_05765 [Candidatus Heimdallarchaeota archaeon B3_Heim]
MVELADFIYDIISGIIIAVVGGSIVAYLHKYWQKNNLRLSTDPSAEGYKTKIIKNTREHKNYLYHDNNAYWYDRSIETHHLYSYIALLIKLEEITELENLLGLKDGYLGYFWKFSGFRKHYRKLKGDCESIGTKYHDSEFLKIIRFRVKEEDNRDIISLEARVRKKSKANSNFNDMGKLDKILNEANETMRYYAEIGKLEI